LLNDLAGLFKLKADDLNDLDRMGQKSAENLIQSIEAARDAATLPRLIYGLGIPHVGRTMADDLAREFGSLRALARADQDSLQSVAGLGPTVASAVEQWFQNPRNQDLLKRLKAHGLNPKAEHAGDRLDGKTLVITGKLDAMTRDDAKEAIRAQGGTAASSVSGRTDYLVVGEDPGQTKLDDADENDVETVDEKTLLELLGRSS
jgi:DNA ligase (NAD+)